MVLQQQLFYKCTPFQNLFHGNLHSHHSESSVAKNCKFKKWRKKKGSVAFERIYHFSFFYTSSGSRTEKEDLQKYFGEKNLSPQVLSGYLKSMSK